MNPLSRIEAAPLEWAPPSAEVAPAADFEAALADAQATPSQTSVTPTPASEAAPPVSPALVAVVSSLRLEVAPADSENVATSNLEPIAAPAVEPEETEETVDVETPEVASELQSRPAEAPVESAPEIVARMEPRPEPEVIAAPEPAVAPKSEAHAEEVVAQVATDLESVAEAEAAPQTAPQVDEVDAHASGPDQLRVELGRGQERLVIEVRAEGGEVQLTGQTASESVAAAMVASRPLLDAALGKYGLKLRSFDWEKRRFGGEAAPGGGGESIRRIRVRRWQLLA